MINERLMEQARNLADRPYALTVEVETLSNEQEMYLLRHPELRGTKAQGRDLLEATNNLNEATVDFIYTLLVEGFPVPEPQTTPTLGPNSSGSSVWMIDASVSMDEAEAAINRTIPSEQRKSVVTLSFGGDLVKQA